MSKSRSAPGVVDRIGTRTIVAASRNSHGRLILSARCDCGREVRDRFHKLKLRACNCVELSGRPKKNHVGMACGTRTLVEDCGGGFWLARDYMRKVGNR